jgi:hypothetical protein
LLFGEFVLALNDIGLPKVLAHLRVSRIERDRLKIVANSFVGPSQLAGRRAAVVERAPGIGIFQEVELVDRFLIPVGLGERIGVFGEIGAWQDRCAS